MLINYKKWKNKCINYWIQQIIYFNELKNYSFLVGAGTAGCVMASRLSEDPNSTVLLVEAGGYFNWISSVPLAAPLMINSHMDWAYKTEPQWYSSKGFHEQVRKINFNYSRTRI